ncbi:helix-turn-helix domain-containing protein [Amycolatopsis thermophila]|uniref:MarR family transcriptional regulator n=1 Tax=Amycolatopsis thermophila TaxID=206084 RepID=A0ABU0EXV5_9PSEU|nr:hypothetical protein [Amycolatopsis thermophila]MDQ0380098.1 hypothetical protein [Amycolatopsis thermophila]
MAGVERGHAGGRTKVVYRTEISGPAADATAWWMNTHGGPTRSPWPPPGGTDVEVASQVLRQLEDKDLIRREVDRAGTRAERLRTTERGADGPPRQGRLEAVDAAFFQEVPGTGALVAMLRTLADPGAG